MSVAAFKSIPRVPTISLHKITSSRLPVCHDRHPVRRYHNAIANMADEPPPAKRVKYASWKSQLSLRTANGSRYNFKATFEILTGEKPSQQTFTVHREPFTQCSKFLEAASSSRWRSGDEKPVDLTEHEPGVFASYMQCVYFGSVAVPEIPGYSEKDSLGALIVLYLLADKLNDVPTTNLVMDEIIVLSEEVLDLPCSDSVTLAYDSTVAGSPLRKLCRDYYVNQAKRVRLEKIHQGRFPFQSLQDVVLEFERLATSDGPDDQRTYVNCVDREKCYYHQHDDEHPRCL